MVSLDIPALFILAACAVTLLAMALTYYTFTKRSAEMELRLLAEYRRAVAERVGGMVTLEEQIAAARLAAATAEEQAGVARIYAMEAAESAAEGRITDPGPPPCSERRNVVALRPVTQ